VEDLYYADLPTMTRGELDSILTRGSPRIDQRTALNELARRESVDRDERMERLTDEIRRLTLHVRNLTFAAVVIAVASLAVAVMAVAIVLSER
jgi:hypothetical protein